MQSRLAEEIKLATEPVAIMLADEKPEGAVQFKEGTWGCVVAMYSAAARGRLAVFDKNTTGCKGGLIGLGFCEQFQDMPGGMEYFLSTGRGEGYAEGEGYKKTPELARAFMETLPRTVVAARCILFKPLSMVDPASETPTLVSILANPDQLSALAVLANYDRPTADNVIMPHGAGCHTIFLYPYQESKKETPKAVVGCIDISARPYVDPEYLSFTVPWPMFLAMESNISGSFLERKDWKKVRERIAGV